MWSGGLVRGPMRLFVRAVLGVALLSAAQVQAESLADLAGTVGHNRVGMTLALKGDKDISGGHYFYVHYLKDIPLTGSIQGSEVMLKTTDGGTFELRFKGNGSEGGKPSTFANSVGLEGTWKKGSQKLLVTLNFTGMSQGVAAGHRYASVTSESDAAFEAKVQGFWRSVLAGKKSAAALYVSFPLRINQGGKTRTISSAQELTAQWNQIFTPAYLTALRSAVPHDMFTRNGQVMLGDGIAWFDAKGAVALNLP